MATHSMTTEPRRPTQTGAKQLYRVDVICSQCGYTGEMPWVRNENRCPRCGSLEMRR
jgi:predicted Zn-ribbon and HTH transcriptional regulator